MGDTIEQLLKHVQEGTPKKCEYQSSFDLGEMSFHGEGSYFSWTQGVTSRVENLQGKN